MRDLYSVLNLSRRASSKDIKSAYWALAKQFHPDVNAGDKEAEGWTKEINRAYEILGDCDARAAYDLELACRRTKARTSFLRGATAGAAAVIVAAGSIAIVPVWKHHAWQTRSIKNEMVAANAPAQERTNLKSAPSEHLEVSANRGEPGSAPLTRSPNEMPGSTRSKMTSTAPGEAPAPGEAQPGTAPSEPSRTARPERQQPLPLAQPPAPRTGLANVALPEVKKPATTAPAGQEPSSEPLRPDGHRRPEAAGKKPKKRLNVPRIAAATPPNKLQGSEREPRLVSSRATALRWPSADEPFVNVGARNR